MSPGQADDPVAEYVAVLRGFGIDDEEVVSLHGEDASSGVDPVRHVRLHLPEDPASLFEELHAALARSSIGINAPVEYWDSVPEVQVGSALSAYGYDLRTEETDEGFRIGIRDEVSGDSREGAFAYPDGPLGDNNYPALVDAVERGLEAGLRFCLLTVRDRRWRFVLVDEEALAQLRDRYGDRVTVFGRPLLCAHQPPDFAGGAPEAFPAEELLEGPEDGFGVDREMWDDAGDDSDPNADSSPDPDPDAAADAGTDDRDAASTADAGRGGDGGLDEAVPDDAPAWVRRAAATEGGMDDLVEALSEGGPREHVSDRTADDVLAEAGDPDAVEAGEETTGQGIDEVFETLEETAGPGEGPTEVVADEGVDDVFDQMDGPGPEASDADARDSGESTADSSGGATGDRATDRIEFDPDPVDLDGDDGFESLSGGDPEAVVADEGVDDVFDQMGADPETIVESGSGDDAAADAGAEADDEVAVEVEADDPGLFESFGEDVAVDEEGTPTVADESAGSGDATADAGATESGAGEAAGADDDPAEVEAPTVDDLLEMTERGELDSPFMADDEEADAGTEADAAADARSDVDTGVDAGAEAETDAGTGADADAGTGAPTAGSTVDEAGDDDAPTAGAGSTADGTTEARASAGTEADADDVEADDAAGSGAVGDAPPGEAPSEAPTADAPSTGDDAAVGSGAAGPAESAGTDEDRSTADALAEAGPGDAGSDSFEEIAADESSDPDEVLFGEGGVAGAVIDSDEWDEMPSVDPGDEGDATGETGESDESDESDAGADGTGSVDREITDADGDAGSTAGETAGAGDDGRPDQASATTAGETAADAGTSRDAGSRTTDRAEAATDSGSAGAGSTGTADDPVGRPGAAGDDGDARSDRRSDPTPGDPAEGPTAGDDGDDGDGDDEGLLGRIRSLFGRLLPGD